MAPIFRSLAEGLDAVRASYRENGIVVVRQLIGPSEVEQMRAEALELVRARGAAAGISIDRALDLDDGFNLLCRHDRMPGSDVYQVLRRHPGVVRLLDDPGIVSVVKALIEPRMLYYAHDQIRFRIDRKGEGQHALDWHQDYWYNNTTSQAVTAVYCLTELPPEAGPLAVLPGSHRSVCKVRIAEGFRTQWNVSKVFEPVEPIDEKSVVEVPIRAGDVLFLHALLLHRSGVNRAEKHNRWTVVTRYTDALSPEFVAKGWKQGVSKGYVSLLETNPEHIVNADQVR